jgi:hypothetical protein
VRDTSGRCIEPSTPIPSTCDDASCPADVSTVSSGPGFCCASGNCSCGGVCCEGPDCWIRSVDLRTGENPTLVTEVCERPEGCLQCPNSGTRCCDECTESGDCLPACIQCEGASGDACCIDCTDEAPFCIEPPENTPISGGRIRRR